MENLRKGILVKNGICVGAVGDKYFSTCPIGTVQAFSGNTIPHGYLLADGASYKVADYPDLYAVVGNTYGGDTENFNVPNLVDKFIQGSTASGTEKEAGLPNITGTFYHDTNATSSLSGAFFSYTRGNSRNLQNDEANANSGYVSFDASKSNAIYGNSDTVQPPALTMVYIIKAFHTNEGVDSGVSDDVVEYVDNKVDALISDTDLTSTSSTWSSSKINSNLNYKTNFNVTSMTELGFTRDSYVSVKDFWNKLVSRFGTNGTIRFSWRDTNKAYLGTSNNNVLINGGMLIYTTYGSPAEWRDFSAIYVGSYNNVVFHIRCVMMDNNDANTIWSITSLSSPINDSSTSATSTWSSSMINSKLGGLIFSASGTTLTITDGTNTWTLKANS